MLTGCKKKSNQIADEEIINLTISNGNNQDLIDEPQKWHLTNKKVCVVFGYDFNESEITQELISLLKENFGLAEDGGLVYPLVYPDDFKHGTKGYINDLVNELQSDSNDFCGLIILGAPENTHKAIARNQDKWNQEVPYPVITLFPQDDVLGLESNCDIVIDKKQSANIEGLIDQEESEGKLIAEAPEVLLKTIKYVTELNYSLKRDSSIQKHVLQMLSGLSIHHYIDPETGLKSINHFVID